MSSITEQFNKLKHSLPILLRINKNEFYTTIEELKKISPHITSLEKIDLFYTLHSLNIRSLWLSYLIEIFESLEYESKVEVVKFSSFYVETDEEIKLLKKLYESILDNLTEEDAVMKLCFIDGLFFKPLLHSSIKTMKMMNSDLISFIAEKCLTKIHTQTNIILCLERLANVRSLTNKEIDYLITFVKNTTNDTMLIGRVIDVLLRCGREDAIKAVSDIVGSEKYYTSDHGVHYFDILEEAIEKINDHKTPPIFETVHEMLNYGKIISTTKHDLENLLHLANMIITTNYVYTRKGCKQTLKLSKCFSFAWNVCDEVERKYLIEDVFLVGNICCYGLMINILIDLSGFGKGVFLSENAEFSSRCKILSELKEQYPPDDLFWTDAKKIEEAISSKKKINKNNII